MFFFANCQISLREFTSGVIHLKIGFVVVKIDTLRALVASAPYITPKFVVVGVSEILMLTLGRDTLQQYVRLAEVRERLESAAAASGTAS